MRAVCLTCVLAAAASATGRPPGDDLAAGAPLVRPLAERIDDATAQFRQKLAAGEEAVLVIVGDSISNKINSYNWHLRAILQNRYGVGGEGYRAFAPGYRGANNDLLAPPRPAMHLERYGEYYTPPNDAFRDPTWGPYAPDGRFTLIENDGTIEARVYGPGGRLWFLEHPGGGTMTAKVDGETFAVIDTDSPTIEMRSVEFATKRAPDETATITLTTDGDPVIFLGTDTRTGWPGVTYHRVAQGGAGPHLFLFSATEQCKELLASMEPDLVIVMLDWPGGPMATYVEDMHALLDFYEEAWPDAGIILQTHHPYSPAMAQEASWLLAMARQRGYGYINLYDLFAGYEDMNARGFMDGSIHFTFEGGLWFGHYIDWLLRQAPHTYATCADWNFDGELNVLDMAAFQNAWAEGDADVNYDGAQNIEDWLTFSEWYATGSCY